MQKILTGAWSPASSRILWLDFAKSYGMILVFWGHLIESFYNVEYSSSFLSYKFVYSFHIPLFFLLSGYLAKKSTQSFQNFFKVKFLTRIVPLLFFNLIGFLALTSMDLLTGGLDFQDYSQKIFGLFIRGLPAFNIVTWFLACLFAVEMIHFFLSRHINSKRTLLLVAVGLFGLGWGLTWQFPQLGMNYWFFPEATVAYLFYALGHIFQQKSWLNKTEGREDLLLFLGCTGVTLLTFSLNRDFFTFPVPIVYMSMSSHGQPFWFLLTGLSGSLATIYLARWSAFQPLLRSLQTRVNLSFIGLNTLILLGLNGLFLQGVNDPLVAALSPYVPDNPVAIIAACTLFTTISFLLCVPAVILLKGFVPQLVGIPKAQGPILRKLL